MTPHFEFFVEEPSAEKFLQVVLPRFLPDCTFQIHAFQGKQDLLAKLPHRLQAMASWLPPDWRIVVLVDRDDEHCLALKARLDGIAMQANLRTRSLAGGCAWQAVIRIAVEELEAWYFGDWEAVRKAYPKVSRHVPQQAKFRDPDAIAGGTWEALERVLQKAGYFKCGLPKIKVAQEIGRHFDPRRCRSQSFSCFWKALIEATSDICS